MGHFLETFVRTDWSSKPVAEQFNAVAEAAKETANMIELMDDLGASPEDKSKQTGPLITAMATILDSKKYSESLKSTIEKIAEKSVTTMRENGLLSREISFEDEIAVQAFILDVCKVIDDAFVNITGKKLPDRRASVVLKNEEAQESMLGEKWSMAASFERDGDGLDTITFNTLVDGYGNKDRVLERLFHEKVHGMERDMAALGVMSQEDYDLFNAMSSVRESPVVSISRQLYRAQPSEDVARAGQRHFKSLLS